MNTHNFHSDLASAAAGFMSQPRCQLSAHRLAWLLQLLLAAACLPGTTYARERPLLQKPLLLLLLLPSRV
jgi:hypothetical protein